MPIKIVTTTINKDNDDVGCYLANTDVHNAQIQFQKIVFAGVEFGKKFSTFVRP